MSVRPWLRPKRETKLGTGLLPSALSPSRMLTVTASVLFSDASMVRLSGLAPRRADKSATMYEPQHHPSANGHLARDLGKNMGGYGSGRTAWRNQGLIEGCHTVDVLALRRERGFGPEAVAIRVPFTNKDGSAADQRVALSWTACRFGGFRPWFECPSCG